MASISKRNGKYAVTYYEGDDRHPVMKSGLTASQAEKLRDKKNAEEKKWREQRKKAREKAKKQVVKRRRPPMIFPPGSGYCRRGPAPCAEPPDSPASGLPAPAPE